MQWPTLAAHMQAPLSAAQCQLDSTQASSSLTHDPHMYDSRSAAYTGFGISQGSQAPHRPTCVNAGSYCDLRPNCAAPNERMCVLGGGLRTRVWAVC